MLLLKRKARYLAITFVCLILSFMVTLQVRSVLSANSQTVVTADSARLEELQKLYNTEKERSTNLEAEVKEYRSQLENFESELENAGGDAVTFYQERLRQAELLAGMTEVTGPGVVVTLDDMQQSAIPENDDPNAYVVHDSDLLMVLNELRDAGAEAISINGERVLATSEVRCAGSVVSVNNNRISAPFVIRAIGDPEKLSAGLQMRNGAIDQLAVNGIVTKLEPKTEIEIGAYTSGLNFQYASPKEEE